MPLSRPTFLALLVLGPIAQLTAGVAHAASTRPDFGPYLVGADAMQSNDFATAANGLLRALAADPKDGSIRRRAFLACALSGRPEALRLASGLPGDPAAAMMLANQLAISGRWAEARQAYAELPHDSGVSDLMRPLLVAWAQAGAGLTDQAIAGLAPYAAGARLPALYAAHAGMIADMAGKADVAAQFYHLAQDDSAGISLDLVRLLASFAARHGHEADGRGLIRALVRSSGQFAIAGPGLEASLDQKLITGARDGLARAYLAVGTFMLASSHGPGEGDSDQGRGRGGADGQPSAAREGSSISALLMLRYAAALSPGFDEAQLALADVEQSLKDTPAALAALRPVAPTDPLAALVQLREAQLLAGSGASEAALAAYDRLSSRNPQVAEIWRERGELLSDMHRYPQAVASFDHAIADIAQPAGDDWALFFDRAVALDRAQHFDLAEKDLRHALALSPEQPYVLNYLGYSYAEQGRNLEEAHRMLSRAIDQKPQDGAFLDSLGWIELQQGDTTAALATLQQAAELTPEDPTANYHLGVAYWKAGRRVEAEQQWQRALILEPDASDRPKIEARLKEAQAGTPVPGKSAGP